MCNTHELQAEKTNLVEENYENTDTNFKVDNLT